MHVNCIEFDTLPERSQANPQFSVRHAKKEKPGVTFHAYGSNSKHSGFSNSIKPKLVSKHAQSIQINDSPSQIQPGAISMR